jgi:nitroreductase
VAYFFGKVVYFFRFSGLFPPCSWFTHAGICIQQKPIDKDTLRKLFNAARVAPSAFNMQPLKYLVVNGPALVDAVFQTTSWANYLEGKGTPALNKKSVVYIIVLADKSIRENGYAIDIGLALENLTLTAWEEGIGCCIQGSIDRDRIKTLFNIPDRYIINDAVAMGYRAEQPVLVDAQGDDIKYYKYENGTLHVPKRKLEDITFWNKV